MPLVVLGGMLTAALLILVVLPVLYDIIHWCDASHGEGEERG
jgi:Cu/Ag efflux pump CusA